MQPIKTSLFVLMGLLSLPGCGSTQNDATTGLLENKVPGTATLSGKITAPAACEAARMYAQNMDRNVIYMVYTGDGNGWFSVTVIVEKDKLLGAVDQFR